MLYARASYPTSCESVTHKNHNFQKSLFYKRKFKFKYNKDKHIFCGFSLQQFEVYSLYVQQHVLFHTTISLFVKCIFTISIAH